VAGVLGLLVGLVALNRLRSDYLAIVTVSVGAIAYDFVGNFTSLFNGWDGIAGVPYPFNDQLKLDPNSYIFFYILLSGIIMAILWVVANRLTASPLGRSMRAIRGCGRRRGVRQGHVPHSDDCHGHRLCLRGHWRRLADRLYQRHQPQRLDGR
jgi:ABC-type branched-subunit amino acid transport system permease subunit